MVPAVVEEQNLGYQIFKMNTYIPLHSRPKVLSSLPVRTLSNIYYPDSTPGMIHHRNDLLVFLISLILVFPAKKRCHEKGVFDGKHKPCITEHGKLRRDRTANINPNRLTPNSEFLRIFFPRGQNPPKQ